MRTIGLTRDLQMILIAPWAILRKYGNNSRVSLLFFGSGSIKSISLRIVVRNIKRGEVREAKGECEGGEGEKR